MIREYKKDDLESVVSTWLEASIIAHDFIAADYWRSQVEAMHNVYIPNSRTFVYEDEEKEEVVGFVSLDKNFIAAIFINPQHQRNGIGKQLIDHVKSLYDSLSLCVYSENKNSIAFYKRQGFVVVDERLERNTGHRELLMEYNKSNLNCIE